MKIKTILGLLCFITILSVSCNEVKPYMVLSAYDVEVMDTTISADEHEFIVKVHPIDNVGDWNAVAIHTWEDYYPGDDKWQLNSNGVQYEDNRSKAYLDWITVEKYVAGEDGISSIKITVKKNETNKARAIRIYVGKGIKNCTYTNKRDFIIWQKAKADGTPFVVKAKGQLYETNAHLNEKEELVYDSRDFKNLMEYIK